MIETIENPDPACWCPLYQIPDTQSLAVRIGVPVSTLQRLAHARNNYFPLERVTGHKLRRISVPRLALREVQRTLHEALRRIAPPPYVHSGRKGRSHLTHAATHHLNDWVIKIDLKSYYDQVTSDQVRRFFSKRLLCPYPVALLLTRLCTLEGHLPMGAHTSQPLAFLAAQRMFDDLDGMAREAGNRYTLYIDDLCFSGPNATPSFLWEVKKTIHRHGYNYHHAVCYRPQQDKLLTGVLLTSRGMTLAPTEARRIRLAVHDALQGNLSNSELLSLQGLLGVAGHIDGSYRPLARVVTALQRGAVHTEPASREQPTPRL